MEDIDDRAQVEKMANAAIAENSKALKEIARLMKLIDDAKHKRESVFKALGITKEIQEKDISVSDLPSGERKILDALQREFLAELSAKGIDLDEESTKKKSTVGLSMARKRLKI